MTFGKRPEDQFFGPSLPKLSTEKAQILEAMETAVEALREEIRLSNHPDSAKALKSLQSAIQLVIRGP